MTEIILLASSITLKKFNQHDDNHIFTILLYHLTFLKTMKFNKKAVYKKINFPYIQPHVIYFLRILSY